MIEASAQTIPKQSTVGRGRSDTWRRRRTGGWWKRWIARIMSRRSLRKRRVNSDEMMSFRRMKVSIIHKAR
jgi:hypothetical protein